ncbi:putative PX-associated protein [Lyophyllum shimeji]|uniref:PX-associated protein n=1 Tax=Lyophyllum shimeji TaxID=47721 RepID=A0A9P3UHE7_LYOSH|nr:putative PX-associated protein [Lyophyllum shimeji]
MDIDASDQHDRPTSPHATPSVSHSASAPPQATIVSPPPIRPRRPTRSLPPLPPLVTGSDEPGIDNDHQHDEQPVRSSGEELSPLADNPQPAADLTPLRAHYLKKSLIQLQFRHEIDAITTHSPTNSNKLSFLGPPFTPPPRNADPYLDLPFLRYIFRQFVLTFPFMAAAPKDFYSEKLQPFVTSALSRNLSPTSVLDDDDSADATVEQATRKKLMARVERNLALFLGAATNLVEPEQVVRLNQSDLDRLEALAKKRMAKLSKTKTVFEVNVIGVRTVVDKGRIRSRAHEEFIIRTRRSNFPDIFVSRRYGDFRTLASELQRVHPNEQIRPPPPKDRTAVISAPMSPPPDSYWEADPSSQSDIPPSPPPGGLQASRLAREKNRLTLRAYLHSLLATSTIASSPVLKSFLLSGPVTLTQEELEDAQRREEADRVREDGRKRFAKEISDRVEGLREAVRSVKGDVMGKDGLTHIFATIKVTPDIRDLPQNYQGVIEWARISLASTVFHQFAASDSSSETFASLKRIHGLMPYFMLKAALKISNPIAMIRGVLDLFLAQPFGGRSLLQRMFTSSLAEEVKALENDIEAVKDKVDDPIMCAKIRQFVYAPREIQDMYKADAVAEQMNLLTVVLRAPDEPILSRVQMHRLAKATRAHQAYMRHRASLADSDDDDGPQNEDAWLLEDLKVLTHLYSRLRDREQLIALIFEGSTAELLKDIITIFYAPLAQVYRAASIADSLSDLQNFINDLIKTVEQVGDLGQEDPHRTVQAFIDLIERHEQSFYHFVHKVHSKGENLFDGLMRWIELFLTVIREGLGSPISLEFLLPHAGKARDDIMAEVDQVALYHYKLKVAYETKIRRRFGRMQERGGDADAEDEAAQELVNGVVGEINFGELIRGDADDLAAEETDESTDDDDDSSDFDSGSTEDDSDYIEDSSSEEERHARSASHQPSKVPDYKTPAPARSQTVRTSRPPSQPPRVPEPPPRKRSLSLRSAKSFLSRLSEDVPPVPPLPPISRSATPDLSSKPLPPSPSSRSFHERPHTPTTPSRLSHDASSNFSKSPLAKPGTRDSSSKLSHDSASTSKHDREFASTRSRASPSVRSGSSSSSPKKKRKKSAQALKPPELQYIPQLLPVFVEMMRPLLRPRQEPRTMTSPSSSR